MNWTIETLARAFKNSYAQDTAYNVWTSDYPSMGHCAVASLVAQEILGGQILKGSYSTRLRGSGTHYWNLLPDGTEVDFTAGQFGRSRTSTREIKEALRHSMLQDKSTRERYELFRKRVLGYGEIAYKTNYQPWDLQLRDIFDSGQADSAPLDAIADFLASANISAVNGEVEVILRDADGLFVSVTYDENGDMCEVNHGYRKD